MAAGTSKRFLCALRDPLRFSFFFCHFFSSVLTRIQTDLSARVPATSPKAPNRGIDMISKRLMIFAMAGIAALPQRAVAQLPIPSLSLLGGASHYDLGDGSGTTGMGAVRLDLPLVVAVGEASFAMLRPTEGGVQRTYVIPEAQLQWQLLPILVKPYLGLGGGWFRAVSGPSPHPSDATVSASAGVRISLPLTGFGLRAEARTRGIGGFSRRESELLAGVSW